MPDATTPDLTSFETGIRALVVGAGGGIGDALAQQLATHPRIATLWATARRRPEAGRASATWLDLDIEDEASIVRAAATIEEAGADLDLVILATGLLHDDAAGVRPEKSWRDIDAAAMAKAFSVNAIGPALVAKHMLPLLARDRKAVFTALSARIGSISDNRAGGWHAYRASKAALNMILRNLAIELGRRSPQAVCVGLHPGTVDTRLSKPFQRAVPEGRLFAPAHAAAQLLSVIDGLAPADSGCQFAWDGQRIEA